MKSNLKLLAKNTIRWQHKPQIQDVQRRINGGVTKFTQIKNYPVQSFATADIVPLILLEIDSKLGMLQSCIVNSVHDSIVIDVHPDELQRVVHIIKSINITRNNTTCY